MPVAYGDASHSTHYCAPNPGTLASDSTPDYAGPQALQLGSGAMLAETSTEEPDNTDSDQFWAAYQANLGMTAPRQQPRHGPGRGGHGPGGKGSAGADGAAGKDKRSTSGRKKCGLIYFAIKY